MANKKENTANYACADEGLPRSMGKVRRKNASRASEESRILKNPSQSGMSEVLLESVLLCPVCGFAKRETMPSDACQFFYECSNCKTLLRPKPGDCCVFCSYGSVQCPPLQGENRGCASDLLTT